MEKGHLDQFPMLDDESWLSDLYFLADLTAHLNELNIEIQICLGILHQRAFVSLKAQFNEKSTSINGLSSLYKSSNFSSQ